MSQYIGKTISLISVTDNRYVGLLENIDSEKGTVTLSNVRCFGTEGRKNWGPEEIFPNPTVYQNVQFNGNDVKDLSILEVRLEDVHPVLPPTSQAPAGLSQQPSQPPQTQTQGMQAEQPQAETATPAAPEASVSNIPAAVAGYGVYAPTEETEQQLEHVEQEIEEQRSQRRESAEKAHSRKASEYGEYRNRDNNRHEYRPRNQTIEIPKSDFDFASNNAKFMKENPETNTSSELPTQENEDVTQNVGTDSAHDESFYDKKSSFFDTISTSAETNTNMRWQEEKELNMDTFGQASVRPRFHSNRGRGNYRGRGRGNYRGRGRGRVNNYRGGHNQNYRNDNNRNNEGYHNQFNQNNQSQSFQNSNNIEF